LRLAVSYLRRENSAPNLSAASSGIASGTNDEQNGWEILGNNDGAVAGVGDEYRPRIGSILDNVPMQSLPPLPTGWEQRQDANGIEICYHR
jgi:hypothetical protein